LSESSASRKRDVAATLESIDAIFLIRYQIDPAVFSRVVSIVTRESVLLVGFSLGEGAEVVAKIPLPEPVDPEHTSGLLDGDQLVLWISKITPTRA